MNRQGWFLLQSGPGHYAANMALDEALLEAVPRLGHSILRFYGWLEPAASFGYFQKIADIESWTPLRPLVRRPTGGGLVPHDKDWTYSVIIPPSAAWYGLTAKESYRRIHEWIQEAFARLGFKMSLAPTAVTAAPGQCFIGCEESDLLWRGQKVAGAAQRRRREGLLIQGSVQPPPGAPARAIWEEAMCEVGRSSYGLEWMALEPDAVLLGRAAQLSAKKFSQESYNRKR